MVCAARGIKCVFVMPDKMSAEKINVLKGYGAQVVVCPTAVAPGHPDSYYSVSDRLARELPGAWKPDQYANPENPASHYHSTGPEIWAQTDGRVTHFVAGIGPSPDKMLQGRLFAYGDAHRYRLGVNHTQLPVNRPHAAEVANHGRDGLMRFDENGGLAKNYEPNSYDGPAETGEALYAPLASDGASGSYEWQERDGDDFAQAGALYRVIDEEARTRLVANIAASLSQVSKDEIVERSVAHFRAADAEYGERVAATVAELRVGPLARE